MKLQAYKNMALFLFLGTFLWGTSFFCVKTALREYSVLQIVFLRVTVAFGLVQLFSLSKRSPQKTTIFDYFHYNVLSLWTLTLPFWCINYASQFLATGVAAILNSLTSLATFVLMATLGLAKGKLRPIHMLGLVLGIGGVFLIAARGDVSFAAHGFGAEMVMILACFSYAVGTLYKDRFLSTKSAFVITRHATFFAMVHLGIFLAASGEGIFFPQTRAVGLAILWLGGACTALGYVIFFYLIQEWGPSRTSTISYVFPFSAYSIGVIALGEPLVWQPLLGGALIAGALFLTRTYR